MLPKAQVWPINAVFGKRGSCKDDKKGFNIYIAILPTRKKLSAHGKTASNLHHLMPFKNKTV